MRRPALTASIAIVALAGCSTQPHAPLTAPVTARGPSQLFVEGVFKGEWNSVYPYVTKQELAALKLSQEDARRFFARMLAARFARFTVVGYADRDRGKGCLVAIRTNYGRVIESEFVLPDVHSDSTGTLSQLLKRLWVLEEASRTSAPYSDDSLSYFWKGYGADRNAMQAAGLPGLYGLTPGGGLQTWAAMDRQYAEFSAGGDKPSEDSGR